MVGWRHQRDPRPKTPKPAAEPLPEFTWNGAAHMTGTCTCEVIYSRCYCTCVNGQRCSGDFRPNDQ